MVLIRELYGISAIKPFILTPCLTGLLVTAYMRIIRCISYRQELEQAKNKYSILLEKKTKNEEDIRYSDVHSRWLMHILSPPSQSIWRFNKFLQHYFLHFTSREKQVIYKRFQTLEKIVCTRLIRYNIYNKAVFRLMGHIFFFNS